MERVLDQHIPAIKIVQETLTPIHYRIQYGYHRQRPASLFLHRIEHRRKNLVAGRAAPR